MGCSNSPLPKETKFPNYKIIIERQKLESIKEENILQNKKKTKENEQLLKNEEKENDIGKITTQNDENKEPEQPKEKPDLSFDKNICNSIASSLPSRTDTDLETLKKLIKEKTKNLSKKEKAYVVFLWIGQNIEYDIENLNLGKSIDCTPIGVFKNGKTVCSGYARLFSDILIYLGLKVENICGFAKGRGYLPGDDCSGTNHEYNAVYFEDKWYLIDALWGTGLVNSDDKFVKKLDDFYFCADPELLIKSHFPEDSKWQLTNKKYTLDEFSKWPLFLGEFFKSDIDKYSPEEGYINIKDINDINIKKFIIWRKNRNELELFCHVYYLKENCFYEQTNLILVQNYEDRFEVDIIFNKKGKYKIEFSKLIKTKKVEIGVINYDFITMKTLFFFIVELENDSKKEIYYPRYSNYDDIKIIEPVYDNLKLGEKIKFKLKSDLENIYIYDGEKSCNLFKNKEGFFEKEIIITGKTLSIGKITVSKTGTVYKTNTSQIITFNVIN